MTDSKVDSTSVPVNTVKSQPAEPFRSALNGEDMLRGPEMSPFKGYIGAGPEPQQVIYDLRWELRELHHRIKDADEQITRLKALVASLRRE
jgi:hypothetical protein